MISFRPLFHTLLDKGLTATGFCKSLKISTSTLARMKHGKNVSLEVVERMCKALRCSITDVVEITLDEGGSGANDKGGGGM